MKRAIYAAIVAMCMSVSLLGQALSGTIVGTVTDQAGAVIPAAKVTLTNEGTQFTRTVETNQSGQYVAFFVSAGPNSARSAAPRFSEIGKDRSRADSSGHC